VLGRHRPTIVAVQHDFMRALWLKDCGRGTESWHALCNATRLVQHQYILPGADTCFKTSARAQYASPGKSRSKWNNCRDTE
jgi:hypothetical protein